MSNSPHSVTKYFHGWLRLVRLPNLLTVPGDVLAGVAVMVCTPGRNLLAPPTTQIVTACVASLLLYIAGLLCNDLVDQKRDTRERPSRPLPSGAVPRSHVIAGLLASCIGAILLGYYTLPAEAVGVETVLLALILSYNVIKQKFPITGGVLMGLCRGLNLLFGASILTDGMIDQLVFWPFMAWGIICIAMGMVAGSAGKTENKRDRSLLYGAFFVIGILCHPLLIRATTMASCWMAYILVVTLISQRETTGHVKRGLSFLPIVILLASAVVYYFIFRPTEASTIALMCIPLALTLLLAARSAYRIARKQTPIVVQKSIGTLIRNLILMQSAACVCWDLRLAAALLALWPVNYLLCRWFYAS